MSKHKTEILNSFMSPATKFEVTSFIPHKKHIEGTVGYISFSNRYKNRTDLLSHRVKIIRRGKTGVPRIEDTNILTPSYYENVRDENLEKSIGCSYEALKLLEIKSVDVNNKDVMSMEPLEFIGWAAAYATLLHYIRHTYITQEKSWPKGNKNILNTFHFIHRNFSSVIKDPNGFFAVHASPGYRIAFIEESRKKEIEFMRGIQLYRKQQKNNESNALVTTLGRLNSRTVLYKRIKLMLDEKVKEWKDQEGAINV